MGWYCARCGQDAEAAGICPRDGEMLARVSSHDLLGRTLGEYRVLASLGGGAFGAVYRAIHERSGMVVAIKLLHRPLPRAGSGGAVAEDPARGLISDAEGQRVITEARAAAMLNHPNVVQVFDLAVTSDRRPYIVMQHLDGAPLSQHMGPPGKPTMPIASVLSVARDLLAGLGAAHARGIVHRDLKPDNIYIAGGRAIVVDFGLAKLVADPRLPNLTMTGEAIGTPHYMAPEQIRGVAVDARSDLYAVGCVLFEALAGRPPFDGAATFALFDAHLHEVAPSIRSLRPDVPPAVDAAIARALAKDPAARFASAGEMDRALHAPSEVVPVVRTSTRPRRRRWPFAVAGVLALAAVIAIAVVTSTGPSSTASNAAQPARPPLDPQLEAALQQIEAGFRGGHYNRASIVQLMCATEQMVASPDALKATPTLAEYAHRLRTLVKEFQPDFDLQRDCKLAPGAKLATGLPIPHATGDEPELPESLYSTLLAVHAQLEAGRIDRRAAGEMYCYMRENRRTIERELGSRLPADTRSYYRRYLAMLKGYFPDLDKAACKPVVR